MVRSRKAASRTRGPPLTLLAMTRELTPSCGPSELAITASHCRREGRQQQKQRHLAPEKAPHPGNGLVGRRGTGAPPFQERERGWKREETYRCERPDLGPEECIVRVVGPALRGKDREGEADDEYEGCEETIPRIDRHDAGGGRGVHATPYRHELRKENAEESEDEEMVQNSQSKIEIKHRSYWGVRELSVADFPLAGDVRQRAFPMSWKIACA